MCNCWLIVVQFYSYVWITIKNIKQTAASGMGFYKQTIKVIRLAQLKHEGWSTVWHQFKTSSGFFSDKEVFYFLNIYTNCKRLNSLHIDSLEV